MKLCFGSVEYINGWYLMVLVNSRWHWVSTGHICLRILKKSGDLVIALADTASFKKNEYFLVNIGDLKKMNYFFNEYSGF